ncbi:MAG: four helix bundle protein [Candidatus Levybacteria bacterium]|nr:four helix bundle protein [Candidatus Levybacteria bacterium]
MNSYKELTVWQKSVELCVSGYKITEEWPKAEQFGLTFQVRKCFVSIPSNIAEGQRRGHKAEYIQFIRIAYGSGAELETQLLVALKVGYLSKKVYDELDGLLEEVMKMLNRLLSVLQNTTDYNLKPKT